MNSKTTYLETKVLRAVLHNEPFSIGAAYLGVTVAGVEPVGKGYARVLLDPTKWSPEADDGAGGTETHYTQDVFMPQATGDWGLCDGWVICDALDGGNVVLRDVIAPAQNILNTNQFKVPAGQLSYHEA
jgi:hypothetical protein